MASIGRERFASADVLTVPEPSGSFSARIETGSMGGSDGRVVGWAEDRNDLRFSLDMAQLFRQIIGLRGQLMTGCPERVVGRLEFVILTRFSP